MIPQKIFSFWLNLYIWISDVIKYVFQFFLESKAFFIKIREGKVTYKNVSSTNHSTTKGRRYLIFAWKFLRLRIIFCTTFKSIRSLQLFFRCTFRLKRWRFISLMKPHTCKELLLVIFRLSSSETASFAWDRKMIVRYINHKKAWKMRKKLCYDR